MKKYKTKGSIIFDFLVNFTMVLTVVICLIPFVYILALSLSSSKAIINNEVFLFPKDINFGAYVEIFNYPNFFHAYKNTLIYTTFGTAISLFLIVLFAYPLSKTKLKGNTFIMKIVVFSMFFTGGLIPNYLLVSYLHLTNTIWAMLIPFAINPFNLILMINFFKSIPKELEEAALIDGLDYFGILWKIILPLSQAGLATVGLYTAVFFWNDWFNGLIYLKSSQFPVMLFLRNIVNGTSMVGDAAGLADKSAIGISIKGAVIIVTTVPIIAIYPFLQKYFVKGVMIGSIKG